MHAGDSSDAPPRQPERVIRLAVVADHPAGVAAGITAGITAGVTVDVAAARRALDEAPTIELVVVDAPDRITAATQPSVLPVLQDGAADLAVSVVRVTDAVKRVDVGEGDPLVVATIDRSVLRVPTTPAVARRTLVERALAAAADSGATTVELSMRARRVVVLDAAGPAAGSGSG